MHAALSRLRIAPLFKGVRGEGALDIDALAQAALRLSAIIAAGRNEIASIDLNPVMVAAQGSGLTIVDALVERRGSRD